MAGWIWNGSFFEPYRVFNLDPIILGLVVSFMTVYVVTLWTPAPSKELVRRYFYKREAVKRETPNGDRYNRGGIRKFGWVSHFVLTSLRVCVMHTHVRNAIPGFDLG